MQGFRVHCTDDGFLPKNWRNPGAYGRVNRTCAQVYGFDQQLWWQVCAPDGSSCSLNPAVHAVTEHDDGSITVNPSIVTATWHGWLRNGVWQAA